MGDSLLGDAKADEPTDKKSAQRTNANKRSNDDCLYERLKHARAAGRIDEGKDHESDAK